MYRRRSRLLLGALLVAGMLVIFGPMSRSAADEDEDVKAAKAAVTRLAKDIADGKKVSDETVKQIVKKHDDLEAVMSVYKAEKKGDPTLERILEKLAKKKTFAAKDKATLKKVAELSRALALLTPHYTEKTKGSPTKKKEWDKYVKDMDEGAVELLKALKGGKDKEIATTSTKLSGSCTDCHGAFRTSN
jgi:hypothetical protein